MRKALVAIVALGAVSLLGCKKTVPNDVVERSLRGALSTHSPITTSAMCGVKVRGLIAATITVKQKNPDNTGIAHVRGSPWAAPFAPPYCEGDLEFKYTFTQKTSGYKRKTTTTTWYLEHVKLLSIQTPGVKGSGTVDEDPDGDD